MTVRLTRTPLAVACPVCGAATGVPCVASVNGSLGTRLDRRPDGIVYLWDEGAARPGSVHQGRWHAANADAYEAAEREERARHREGWGR